MFHIISYFRLTTRCSEHTLFLSRVGPLSQEHLLTPQSSDLLEKLTGPQIVKKFPALYGTRRFITAFTSARHLSLSWAISIQSMSPQPTSWRSILILYSHLRLGLQSGLFPSGVPTKTLYTHFLSPTRARRPVLILVNPSNAELNSICHLLALLGAHPIFHVSRIRVNLITRTMLGEEYI